MIGNDATIVFCGTQGNFELNVTLPVIAHDLYESIRLLANAMLMFAERCVDGIEADVERCRELAGSSPAIATALAPALGYERVTDVVKQAVRERRTIRSVVLERGLLDEATVDRLLDLDAMSRGETPRGLSRDSGACDPRAQCRRRRRRGRLKAPVRRCGRRERCNGAEGAACRQAPRSRARP